MIVTSDNTPLSAISTDARTGSPTRTNLATALEPGVSRPPRTRPTTTKTRTGKRIDPNAPSGSRRKILISSQVNFQSPWNMSGPLLVANRMSGQLQKHVFERGEHSTEIGDPDPVFGQTLDHLCHELVAPPLNREARLLARHQ